MIEQNALAYNVCRVVGHDMFQGRFCERCGLHKFIDDLGANVSKVFYGHPRSRELGDYIHAYARKVLDEMVSTGSIFRYHDLRIARGDDHGFYIEFSATRLTLPPTPLVPIKYAVRLSI